MFTLYEVGGCVRDSLLGVKPKDIDYVAVPNASIVEAFDNSIQDVFNILKEYLQRNGYEIFLATPECYTIRARFSKDGPNTGKVVDFVLARKEIGYKPNTREPVVVSGTLYDDLKRRDFTVNALARSEDGVIIDIFDGQQDLKDKILKTPISGDVTFADDPLRLLRAIRFSITKGFFISEEIDRILTTFDYNAKFGVVSEERIREELFKCFKHNTQLTLYYLNKYWSLSDYIFSKTKLWLKPTNEF